ncbi:MAG: flagellar motor stator protein MotA [Kiloniellales bacterium]
MLIIVGTLVVIGCVIGGYAAAGGHVEVLWQPFEFVIIFGAAIGAFITGNTKAILKGVGRGFGRMFKGPAYNKQAYLDLLSLLYLTFKLIKTKGGLALEQHVENPQESTLFAQFPKIQKDHHVVVFLCDYLRLLTLGLDNQHEMEALMDEEIEAHHHEEMAVSDAIRTMADGMPALGIVAAVLGVIHTMGSITEPPEILGHLIGAALVGTFLGVLLSYGFVGPMASALANVINADGRYYQCIKAGLLAHMADNAPAVSIEFARKMLNHDVRPTFYEVENTVDSLPAVT